MTKVNVLVIGSGGREHALAWKLAQSDIAGAIFCAPGNAGTALVGQNVNIKATDAAGLIEFAVANKIDLTVVGPDQPLVDGIVDEFQKVKLRIFGPTGSAAQIEGSKWFAKQLMRTMNVPTAGWGVFTDNEAARMYVSKHAYPLVIKADGLAAGKGAVVCQDESQAQSVLTEMMVDKKYGQSGDTVVIEDFLAGQEISVFALCDGHHFKLLVPSQDHKAAYDNDLGPNTGGMGAIAPVPWVDEALMTQISQRIIQPVMEGMEMSGIPFVGCLYAGLMITAQGPKVVEFNSRFGDPETQAILPLLKSDLLELMLACCDGTLEQCPPLEWERGYAACVVLTSAGYPGEYKTGVPISMMEVTHSDRQEVPFIHAGTKMEDCQLVTSGGRVLNIVGLAPTLSAAIAHAYQDTEMVHFDGMYCRTDIGAKALAKVSA